MHASRMLSLAKSLSEEELKHFKKFVRSPYFNTNEQLISLYDYIYKYAPKWNSRMLSKELVFQNLFSSDSLFNAKKLGNLMSELSLLFEEFIIQLELNERKLEKKQLKVNALEKRNLDSFFYKNLTDLKEELNSTPTQDLHHHLNLFKVNHKLCFNPVKKISNEETHELLKEAMTDLDLFFTSAKLQLASEMKSRERLLREGYSINWLKEIQSFANIQHSKPTPLIELFRLALSLNENKDSEIYYKLKTSYLTHFESLSPIMKQTILHYLMNFTVQKSNIGESKFIRENFSLYKYGLENEILFFNNRITGESYTNIVIVGIKLAEYEWLEQFMNAYDQYLEQSIKNQIKPLCLAIIAYSKKEYLKARNFIISNSFSSTAYKIRAKSLLMRAIFEELITDPSQFGLFISQSQSFEKFLRRNKKISKSAIQNYIDFIQLLRRLAKVQLSTFKIEDNLNKIRLQFSNKPTIANRPWLHEKINQMEALVLK